MVTSFRGAARVAVSMAVATGLAWGGSVIAKSGAAYEVWVSDQANTQGLSAAAPNGTHGGNVLIYDGTDLDHDPIVDNPLVLDVTADLFPTAQQSTGAHVSRIHGILPSPDHAYMALNFVASGHLGLVHGATRRPVCLFRTTGTTTGRQNHMSFWATDGTHLLIANQNGRFLERLDVVRANDGRVSAFVFNASASLDLVGGHGRIVAQPVAVDSDAGDEITCTVNGTVPTSQPVLTPNGALKEQAGVRPLNTVICPIPSSSGRHAFVTLGGGGMFVVDSKATPMAIVAEYDNSIIRAAGCGGVEAAGFMHLNTGTSAPDVSEFSIYRLPLSYPQAPAFNAPNAPSLVAVWADPENGQIIHGNNRDAHGVVLVRNIRSGEARYLHQMDRVRNNVEVFKVAAPWHDLAFRHEGSYDLTTTGACGSTLGSTRHNDPTPDLGDLSPGGVPHGRRIYVALRGPFPLTVAHAADGSCPGLGIIRLSANDRSGALTRVLPTMVSNFDGTRNNSDPHAAIVRLKYAWSDGGFEVW